MPEPTRPAKIHPFARLEHSYHAYRERRARARGRSASITPFPGYGSTSWVRVLGRVLILPAARPLTKGEYAGVRGWRSFVGIPVAYSQVTVTIGNRSHEVVTDRGGVLDVVLEADLEPGWQTFTVSVEGGPAVEGRAFIVDPSVKFGVVSDVDDTVMVTALPRPLVAAWNSFVVNEHARLPVPGMAVLLDRIMKSHPGAPMIYLSTGAWNIAPTLARFQQRHLFPAGALLLTDWGPTHDRMFRSGQEHKAANLRRLAAEFPDITWLLIGDDGQHDDAIYTAFAGEYPQNVAAVAIRRLSPAEAMLAGGRTLVDDHSMAPWVSASDGSGLLAQLRELGFVD